MQAIIRSPRPRHERAAPCPGGERRGTLPRTSRMRITITGASGLIGSGSSSACAPAATRSPCSRATRLAPAPSPGSPSRSPRPPRRSPAATPSSTSRARTSPSAGATTPSAASASSRELGTRNLVAGIEAADPRPRVLVSSSAVGYYGPHGDERLDEDTPAGDDFLAEVCVIWEREAQRAPRPRRCASSRSAPASCSTRAAARWPRCCRSSSSASAARSPAARQYMPWIHVDDVVGIYLAALDGDAWDGPGQRQRARAGHQQGVLEGARARAAPPGVRARARRSRSARSTARWPRSSPRASAPSRRPRSSSATRSRTPTSTRRCAPRSAS